MTMYELVIYNTRIKNEFTIYTAQDDFQKLCQFLNKRVKQSPMELIKKATVVDRNYKDVSKVHFLQEEIDSQYFLENFESRLICKNRDWQYQMDKHIKEYEKQNRL